MNLKQLEYFVRVAHAGSFTKASTGLSVAQSALSKHVRRLEVDLKQTLFTRHGRGVALTEGGKVVFGHAKKIIEQVEMLNLDLESGRREVRGSVVIATAATTRKALTTKFVHAFRARFPKASLEILEAKSRVIHEWLIAGRIDIGILHGPALDPAVELIRLIDQDLFLISPARKAPVAAGAQVPFKSLARLPLILSSSNHLHSIRTLVDMEAVRLGVRLNVVLQVEGGPFILDLVQQGHGHAILPASSVSLSNLSGQLQLNEIVQPRLARALNLAIASQRPMTQAVRESIKLIRLHLGDGSASGAVEV